MPFTFVLPMGVSPGAGSFEQLISHHEINKMSVLFIQYSFVVNTGPAASRLISIPNNTYASRPPPVSTQKMSLPLKTLPVDKFEQVWDRAPIMWKKLPVQHYVANIPVI